jgi:hypothetical protein
MRLLLAHGCLQVQVQLLPVYTPPSASLPLLGPLQLPG